MGFNYTPRKRSLVGAIVFSRLSVFLSICISVTLLFFLHILLNNLRNLIIFCINVDIHEMLLIQENKGPGSILSELFPVVILEKR